MKLFKIISLLVLSLCFLTACANLSSLSPTPAVAQPTLNSERKLHEPDEFKTTEPAPNFYVRHFCWKSPFNPHEVIHYWIKLSANQINEQIVVALVGNPKIDWSDYKAGSKCTPMNVKIPAGEIASAVIFVFAKTQSGTIELMGYGYNDDIGVKRMYVLNPKTKCYERVNVLLQQQLCTNTTTQTTTEILNTNF